MLGLEGGRTERAAVLALRETVSSAAVRALKRRAEGTLSAGRRLVVIDLREVTHIDIQAQCDLCSALRELSDRAARLAVAGADARVRWVLALCEVDGLELHASVGDALAGRQAHRSQLMRRVPRALLARLGPRPDTFVISSPP